MSRIAREPICIPADVEIIINGQHISVLGKNSQLTRIVHAAVDVTQENNHLICTPRKGYVNGWALAGTTRSLLNGMVVGVTNSFIKHLHLVGVGYRATVQGNMLTLALGFSHLIVYQLPVGITAECKSPTEIMIKGADKQSIGQVAAEIRAYRRPGSYKGKGIRYADEVVRTKEAKKK